MDGWGVGDEGSSSGERDVMGRGEAARREDRRDGVEELTFSGEVNSMGSEEAARREDEWVLVMKGGSSSGELEGTGRGGGGLSRIVAQGER